MSACSHRDDVGAWVLHALDDEDARAFEAHLEGCAACRRDIAELQVVADALPMAAPQVAPPPELKGRLMAVVEAEAQLLRAAGPEADRPPRGEPARRGRLGWLGRLRPVPALALACSLIALGVVGGIVLSGGGDDGGGARVYQAQSPQGSKVTVRVEDGRAQLDLRGMPAPPEGRVYQVWLARGSGKPRATHALFVPRDGQATVEVPEKLGDADTVMVSAEPMGGSAQPTTTPVVTASLT